MRILFVAGYWDLFLSPEHTYGKPSRLVDEGVKELAERHEVTLKNGGMYNDLRMLMLEAKSYDVVFWWPNVPNHLGKLRNVKDFAPNVMLVTSKRNDNDQYNFMELTQRALAVKANMTFEIKKDESGNYHFMVFDPLGCSWYEGNSFSEALEAAERRLEYLRQITRQKTIPAAEDKQLAVTWLIDRIKENCAQSGKEVEVPEEEEFVKLVRKYAEDFHEILKPAGEVKRFLGNASLRPKPYQPTRCAKGMPSFRANGYIFVSQRNVDKEFITLKNFVPTYMEDGKLYYCGENKPSVDAPIQLRLFEALPNINYIIHSHCYIAGAPFTTKPIPCGAIEEVDEVLANLKQHFGMDKPNAMVLNLVGHGSLAFGATAKDLQDLQYYGRTLPEIMYAMEAE